MFTGRSLDSQGQQVIHADNEDTDQTADAQADLSLRWRHMSEGMFSHVFLIS